MPQSPQSPETKNTINEEEARTELLATLAAARELGPDMDVTLAGRYVERLNVLFPNPMRDQARLRNDVEGLLTSARSHSADADQARVKDFLKTALAPTPAPPVAARPPAPPAFGSRPASYIPLLIGAAVIVAIVLASHGSAFWLVWLLPMFLLGGRRQRRYRRYGSWQDGYGPAMPPADSRRQLPPGDGPEIL